MEKRKIRNRILTAVVIFVFLASAATMYLNTRIETEELDLTDLIVLLNVSGRIIQLKWVEYPDCFYIENSNDILINTSCQVIQEEYKSAVGGRVNNTDNG